jgi:hypothetical protein
VFGQLRQKSISLDAVSCDFLAVNHNGTVEELAEILPIEVPAILEFLHKESWIKGIPRLLELQYHEAADQRLVERSRGEHREIVDVTRLVALIAGTDFLGDDFRAAQGRQCLPVRTAGT